MIELKAVGNRFYEEMGNCYGVIGHSKFLNTLVDKETKLKHRDSYILTLLFYTTKDFSEMVEVLEDYIKDIKEKIKSDKTTRSWEVLK